MRLKYIVVENEFGNEAGILFPDSLTHAEVAFFYKRHYVVLGAGFMQLNYRREDVMGFETVRPKVTCFGRSETLNIDSRGEVDAAIMQKLF